MNFVNRSLVVCSFLTIGVRTVNANPRDAIENSFASAQAAQAAIKDLQKKNSPPAEIAKAKGAFNTAVDAIAKEGAKAPEDGTTQAAAGQALVQLDEHTRARPFIDRTIALGRKAGDAQMEAEGLSLLAQSQFQQNDFIGAAAQARAALALAPDNKAALFVLHASEGRGSTNAGALAGDVSFASGRAGVAAQDTRRSAEAATTSTDEAQRSAALLRQAQGRVSIDASAATSLTDAALKLDPRNSAALLMRSRLRKESGDLEGAWADVDKALALNPTSVSAHSLRAEIGIALGKREEDIRRDFLAAGRAEPDFTAFYAAQLAKHDVTASGTSVRGSPPVGFWPGLADRIRREGRTRLMIWGVGLIFFAGALLLMTRRNDGDGRD